MELAIGPEEGISYLTDKGANVSLLLFCGFFLSHCVNNHDLVWTGCHRKGSAQSDLWVKHSRAGSSQHVQLLSDINLWFGIRGKALLLGTKTLSALALNFLAFLPSEVLTCRIWIIGGIFYQWNVNYSELFSFLGMCKCRACLTSWWAHLCRHCLFNFFISFTAFSLIPAVFQYFLWTPMVQGCSVQRDPSAKCLGTLQSQF